MRHKGELVLGLSGMAHQLQYLGYGVVVIGDGIVITAFERPDLRPSAVGILRREQILDAAQIGFFVHICFVASKTRNDLGQKIQLSGGGIVVDGADVIPIRFKRSIEVTGRKELRHIVGTIFFAGLARLLAHVGVLAPAPGRSLKGDNHIRNMPRFRARIPGLFALQRNAARRKAVRRLDRRLHARPLQFVLKGILVGLALLYGMIEIGQPRATLFQRKLGDALAGERLGGRIRAHNRSSGILHPQEQNRDHRQ